MRDQNNEEIVYNLVKVANKQIDKPDEKVDRSSWEELMNKLLFTTDDQLKLLASKVAEYVTENPALRQFILLLALYQSS
jgi:hypothetical protein